MSDKYNLNSIGERIKKLREARKLTQESLGESIGLGKSGVSKIESGKQSPTIEQIFKIADAFQVRTEYILGMDFSVDKESDFVKKFLASFNRITTTKEYSANSGGVYTGEDLIFGIDEDYLVLTGKERLFALIKELANAENLKSKLSKNDYGHMIRTAKQNFKQAQENQTEESYFFLSGQQMTEIIETAIVQRSYLETLFRELGITTPLDGQPLPKLKINMKNRDE